MNFAKMEKILGSYPSYRRRQAWQAIFGRLIESWEEATDLPADLRQKLETECPLKIKANIFKSKEDDSIKAAVELGDGSVVETVLMRHQPGRNTVCLSSQVGCSGACDFCATGRMGFVRQMTAEEIMRQALLFARILKKEGQRINSVVFMGMGEPLLNYGEVMKAISYINDKEGLNIGARHISVSTVGIVEGIRKLSREKKQINLAFSLHAPYEDLRARLMPVSRRYPLRKVLTAIREYIGKTGRMVMIEYFLIENINDSPQAARDLAELLRQSLNKLFFVNLISFNPIGGYRPSSPQKVKDFAQILKERGISVSLRYRFGGDVGGACGQLAGGKNKPGKNGRNRK